MSAGVRYAGGRHSEERARIGTGWLFDASYPQCRDHNPIEYPTCEGSGEDVIRGLDSRDDLSSIGSVILEPLLGTAGNIPPERRFLEKLRRVCDQRDWLLILDESVTGFGRLGQFLASDWFSVTPDVLVLGKGMGGGFPLSGVVASSELWSRSELDMPSVTSTSYGGNPVACAAGVAVLEVLDEGLDVSKTGQSLAQGLVALESASPFVVCSRGIGLMQGFDLIDPETGEAASPELCTTLFRRLLRKGLLLVADVPQVRLTPPLTISIAEVEMCLDILNSVLAP